MTALGRLLGNGAGRQQGLEADLVVTRRELADKRERLAVVNRQISAYEAFKAWDAAGGFRLEKNDCSRLHKIGEAALGRRVLDVSKENGSALTDGRVLLDGAQPFVIQHDWYGVLGDDGGEIVLPYKHCAFEFRISGHSVTVVAMQPEGGEITAVGLIEFDGVWLVAGQDGRELASFRYAWRQVRATCIALDAQVATHDVVRQPAALQQKRSRDGKPPMYDFHVVDLSKRHRAKSGYGGGGEGSQKRLHLRRGHWRHYESHRTWINWMLVGNPDLGFIDKHYLL
jgi:hypothetical protein